MIEAVALLEGEEVPLHRPPGPAWRRHQTPDWESAEQAFPNLRPLCSS